MRHRAVLTRLGGLAVATGVAGCLGGPGGSSPTDAPDSTDSPDPTEPPGPTLTPSPMPTPGPTDSGPHPVTPADTSFEVLERPCGDGRNEATVRYEDDGVSVDGVIGGRDTCHTARLGAARLHRDVLTVVVEVVEERPTATVACAECLTDISYAFAARLPGGRPARVEVVHDSSDGRSTVTTATPS